ncbi:hypothetical protein [Mucilaginibacter sp.]
MTYEIQPAIVCENCIKCGRRPVIEQTKKDWKVKCPNKSCANEVSSSIVDMEQWNRKNKPDIDINQQGTTFKHTA